MQQLVKGVVDSVSLPVTVKTRLGIDSDSIKILEVAKRMEDAGEGFNGALQNKGNGA